MIKNLVFSGGGLKSWAYIGTIKALNELIPYRDIEQVIGVSAGSVFGLMYVLQVHPDVLLDFVMNLNFKEIVDIDIDNILTNQSLLSGVKFMEILKTFISFKIDPDITFKQLKKHSKILFTVNAVNVTDSKLDYFNYKLTPNVKVIDALRASCSLPFLLPCYTINNKNYFDGGLCNNLPIDLVTENDTIAFDLCGNQENNNTNIKLIDLLYALSNITNKPYTDLNKNYIVSEILGEKFKNETVNFKQTKDDIFTIYMTGYKNSKETILSLKLLKF
jgi:NTE family protein